jgi:hypothetical protein
MMGVCLCQDGEQVACVLVCCKRVACLANWPFFPSIGHIKHGGTLPVMSTVAAWPPAGKTRRTKEFWTLVHELRRLPDSRVHEQGSKTLLCGVFSGCQAVPDSLFPCPASVLV